MEYSHKNRDKGMKNYTVIFKCNGKTYENHFTEQNLDKATQFVISLNFDNSVEELIEHSQRA
jgi:hypothetical protein